MGFGCIPLDRFDNRIGNGFGRQSLDGHFSIKPSVASEAESGASESSDVSRVPTVSVWGVVICVLALGAAGTFLLRRRSR